MLTIYKASAGSGKTYQLVLHYLKMVLGVKVDGNDNPVLNPVLLTDAPSQTHRRILAITFTNKATEEMKTRIVANLNEIACAKSDEDNGYIPDLTECFGCTFEQLRTAARHAMVSILLDFTFFNVSTIDSFFQTVLRTFARELGIQGDYNIEINSDEAISSALNLLLDELNAQNTKTEDARMRRIRKWLDNRADSTDGKYNPFKRGSKDFQNIVDEIGTIFTEDFKPLQAELYEYLENPKLLDRFADELRRLLSQVDSRIEAIGHKAETDIKMTGQYDYADKNTKKLIMSLVGDPSVAKADFDAPSAMLGRMISMYKETGRYEYKLVKPHEPSDAYIAAVDTMARSLHDLYVMYRTASLLLSKIPHLEFIGLALKYIDRVRQDANMLILDDTSTYISRIINGSEIPFIYEHLGNRLDHFLIDEFQDTSRLQWKNLLPLVRNSHADGDDSLIIGDIKQAIYRFRNSDATILGSDLENKDFPYPDERKVIGHSRSENRNYRTAHGIVKFNNTILPRFAEVALGVDAPEGYVGSEIRQMCASQTAHLDAGIRIFPCCKPSAADAASADEQAAVYDASADMLVAPVIDSPEKRIATLIAQIQHQVNVEKFDYQDIAILFRFKRNIKDAVDALIKADIPVQSEESLYLRNAVSVKLLVSMLRMLADAGMPDSRKDDKGTDNPDAAPTVNKSERMNHHLFESRYNFFRFYAAERGQRLGAHEAIEKALDADTAATVELITGEGKKTEKVPASLDEAINSILRRHPATLAATIEAVLSAGLIPDGTVRQEKDYIAAFTDLAVEYTETAPDGGDLRGFLTWWDEHADSATITPPRDCNAVRIMSIHRAKGLEFKCVHIYDFNWKLVDERESVWLDIRPDVSMRPSDPTTRHIPVHLPVSPEVIPPLMCFDITKSDLEYPGSPFAEFRQQQLMKMRIDSLNIAYVALTRPVSRLNIYYDYSPRSKSVKTVGDVLRVVLDELTGTSVDGDTFGDCIVIPEESYNRTTGALQLYQPCTTPLSPDLEADRIAEQLEDEKRNAENKRLADLYNSDYRSRNRADVASKVCVNALERNADLDDDEDDDSPAAETVDDAAEQCHADGQPVSERERRQRKLRGENTRRGLDLHEILAHIPVLTDTSPESLEQTFEKAFAKARLVDGFNADAVDDYRRTVCAMLADKRASRWFDPEARVLTEITYIEPRNRTDVDPENEDGDGEDADQTPLYDDNDGDTVYSDLPQSDMYGYDATTRYQSHRIDRLVRYPDGSFDIVDYKFARKESSRYRAQVLAYRDAVRSMHPGATVRAFLWYVDLGLYKEVK